MTNFQELILSLPHSHIAALAWGPKNGKPILAIHGWLDNAASFIPLAPFLEAFRVVAIDLSGHGFSSHHAANSYLHITDYIAEIIAIIDYLGWKQCSLLGHSLGAGLASIVAGTVPERIIALGLIDGIGGITAPAEDLPQLLRSTIEKYSKLDKKQLPHYATENEAIANRLAATKMKRSSVELLTTRGLKKGTTGLTWSTDPRLMFPELTLPTEAQVTPFLKNIIALTCLIRPQNGWPYDEEILNKRIKLVKHIEVHPVPGEHHTHMDNPEVVGPILKEFFSKNI